MWGRDTNNGKSSKERLASAETKLSIQELNQQKIFDKIDIVVSGLERLIILEERQMEFSTAAERLGKRVDNLGQENQLLKDRVQVLEQDTRSNNNFRSKIQSWLERAGFIALLSYLGWEKFK